MAYKFNPFTGKLEEYGPILTGTGTVSAAADGTAALPGIAFANDLNTGIYRPGADQVAISTGGTGRLFVGANGDASIGSLAPLTVTNYTTLAINGGNGGNIVLRNTANTTSAEFRHQGGTGTFLGTITNQPLMFQTNNTERLRITSAGLVGIGTSSPSSILHANGDVTIGSTNPTIVKANGDINFAGNYNGILSKNSTYVYLGSTNNSVALWSNSGTNANPGLIVDSANRVGIGTASPTQRLQITDGSLSNFYVAPGYNSGVGTLLATGGSEYLAFATNGLANERARIDSSGRLLVGTSSYSGNSKVAVTDSVSVVPASYNGASEVINFKALTLGGITSANQLRVTFTLPTNITGYEGFFVAELLVKASFDNVSFPALGGIYKIRVGGVSTGTTTVTSFLTTEVLYTAATQGSWTALTTGDVAVNAVSGTELTLDIDNPGGSNYRYNVFTQYAHNCSNIALSNVAA